VLFRSKPTVRAVVFFIAILLLRFYLTQMIVIWESLA
jgi:hypothetical protein